MSVVLSDLSFSFPNGRVVLSGLNATFGPGRTGLIGVNGSGKSTLLRLITGELRATSGSVTVTGEVGYLPQDLTLDTGVPVASLLGIAAALDAIAAIEAGDVRPELFDAVGDDWDVADRALAWLSRLGLGHVGLDDRIGRLSGHRGRADDTAGDREQQHEQHQIAARGRCRPLDRQSERPVIRIVNVRHGETSLES